MTERVRRRANPGDCRIETYQLAKDSRSPSRSPCSSATRPRAKPAVPPGPTSSRPSKPSSATTRSPWAESHAEAHPAQSAVARGRDDLNDHACRAGAGVALNAGPRTLRGWPQTRAYSTSKIAPAEQTSTATARCSRSSRIGGPMQETHDRRTGVSSLCLVQSVAFSWDRYSWSVPGSLQSVAFSWNRYSWSVPHGANLS
jgi:hypothetical protein